MCTDVYIQLQRQHQAGSISSIGCTCRAFCGSTADVNGVLVRRKNVCRHCCHACFRGYMYRISMDTHRPCVRQKHTAELNLAGHWPHGHHAQVGSTAARR